MVRRAAGTTLAGLAIAVGLLLVGGRAALAEEPYLSDLLDQPSYRAAWDEMIASDPGIDAWVKAFGETRDGVTAPSREVDIGGEAYRYAMVCKPHDCADNQLHVLFAPDVAKAWGLSITGSGEHWLGDPDESLEAVIRRESTQ